MNIRHTLGTRFSKLGGFSAALDTLTTVAMLVAAVTLIWVALLRGSVTAPRTPSEIPVPKHSVSLAGATILGQASARVALLMFSDYECQFCQRFEAAVLPEIRRNYIDTGLAFLAYWHFPLPNHPRGKRAAQAVECAGREGLFWQMHTRVVADPKNLNDLNLSERAGVLGIDGERFRECLDRQGELEVGGDIEVGSSLGVRGTPSFLVGSLQEKAVRVSATISGARPYDVFRKALEQELRATATKAQEERR